MQIVRTSLEILRRFGQKFGPYLVVIVLPGGSLLALLLFLYRRRSLLASYAPESSI